MSLCSLAKENLKSVRIVCKGDADYPAIARKLIANESLSKSPAVIFFPNGVSQLQEVLKFCSSQSSTTQVSVCTGSHSYEGFCSNDGGFVIYLSSEYSDFSRFEVTSGQLVKLGPANALGNVYTELANKYQLGLPGGTCKDVNVGGLVQGGGYGAQCRGWGLLADHLVEVQVVTPSGELLTCSASQNQDLFWALRGGGGGNFGVVVLYVLKAVPIAPKVTTFLMTWKWTDLIKVSGSTVDSSNLESVFEAYQSNVQFNNFIFCEFHLYSQLAQPITDPSSSDRLLRHTQRAMILRNDQNDAEVVVVGWCYALDVENQRKYVQGVVGPLQAATPKDITPPNVEIHQVAFLDGLFFITNGGKPDSSSKMTFFRPWASEAAAAQLLAWKRRVSFSAKGAMSSQNVQNMANLVQAKNAPNGLALISFESVGGKIAAVDSTSTPYPWRDAPWLVQIYTQWNPNDPQAEQEKKENVAWCENMFGAVKSNVITHPASGTESSYVNCPDDFIQDFGHAYYAQNFDRLQQIKGQVDPHNAFRFLQSVPPK